MRFLHTWFLFTQVRAADPPCSLLGLHNPPELSKDGDVLIGGIFSIHVKWDQVTHVFTSKPWQPKCRSLSLREFQNAQTMLFAIEEINNRTDLLPGVKLGYKIYDSFQAIIGQTSSSPTLAIAATVGPLKIPVLVNELKKLHFTTTTGEEVYFNENGDPVARYELLNWQEDKDDKIAFVQVGFYDSSLQRHLQLSFNNISISWAHNSKELPVSVCSPSCPLGTRKAVQKGRPICCFDCIPCAEGEISNITDSITCITCPPELWSNDKRDNCVL
ncbi:extracellular calcium-sensing receptor-like, partial [Tachysurus ichikawai]